MKSNERHVFCQRAVWWPPPSRHKQDKSLVHRAEEAEEPTDEGARERIFSEEPWETEVQDQDGDGDAKTVIK